ncbi:MAG: SurA N-terminal domain-containing protein [Beijerinckiaceae bacterium]|jgi:peptidyl-prolyl cis-trans isomerase SurA
MNISISRLGLTSAILALATLFAAPGAGSSARAQALVATVNDSPITNYDLEQRVKLLRVLRAPATPQAALESIVEDRLKLAEVTKYGLRPSDQDAAAELGRIAADRKVPPASLGAALQAAGVTQKHWQEHGKAHAGWRAFVQALNKTVGVSENEVRAELEKRRGKADANEYRLRQIILIVPRTAGAGAYEARMREAEGLRNRFTDCQAGLQLARGLSDVVVKEPISRSGAQLSGELTAVLERTGVGRLTPPQRGATGVEMLAVCGKSQEGTDGAAAQEIRQMLLARKLKGEEEKLYAPIRKRAVIVRR